MKYAIIFLALFLLACQQEITTFEECVDAGNAVMESYPRQCQANGETFVEEIELKVKELQTCPEISGDFCTMEYNPVCGVIDNGVRCVTEPCASTDVKTFSNACGACNNVDVYYEGACEEQRFVVCQETQTGFDAETFAQGNNGICVDICPGNYDGYVTQIGVELCIPHYGKEAIAQWDACEASTSQCDCVKAYETTRGEEIENPEYRCVPSQYAERLLFRGGQDRLDENGEQSVAIA